MNRKTTPDILGALMGGKKEEIQVSIEQEKNKAINNQELKQVHFDGMEPEVVGEIQQLILKEKATFNLSKAVLSELEDCWIEIRKIRSDKKISRTDIVEQALEDAIKEFKLKKEGSKFYSKLDSNKAIKP